MRGEVKAATWVRRGQSALLGRRLQVANVSWSLPLADCATPLPHSRPPPPTTKGTRTFGGDKGSLPGQRWVLHPSGEQKGPIIGHQGSWEPTLRRVTQVPDHPGSLPWKRRPWLPEYPLPQPHTRPSSWFTTSSAGPLCPAAAACDPGRPAFSVGLGGQGGGDDQKRRWTLTARCVPGTRRTLSNGAAISAPAQILALAASLAGVP